MFALMQTTYIPRQEGRRATHLCLDMTPGPVRQLYGPRAAFSASTTLNQVTAVWLHTAEKPRINHVKRASDEWRVF
jgi:hypothetical protein